MVTESAISIITIGGAATFIICLIIYLLHALNVITIRDEKLVKLIRVSAIAYILAAGAATFTAVLKDSAEKYYEKVVYIKNDLMSGHKFSDSYAGASMNPMTKLTETSPYRILIQSNNKRMSVNVFKALINIPQGFGKAKLNWDCLKFERIKGEPKDPDVKKKVATIILAEGNVHFDSLSTKKYKESYSSNQYLKNLLNNAQLVPCQKPEIEEYIDLSGDAKQVSVFLNYEDTNVGTIYSWQLDGLRVEFEKKSITFNDIWQNIIKQTKGLK